VSREKRAGLGLRQMPDPTREQDLLARHPWCSNFEKFPRYQKIDRSLAERWQVGSPLSLRPVFIMSLAELPVELVLLIASLVDERKDLGVLRLLSKRCNSIIQPVLWKNNVLTLKLLEIPNLLSSIQSVSSSLGHYVTALLIGAELPPQNDAEAASLLHQVLESLPELEVLYISSLRRLYGDLRSPCPAGLHNIRSLHLQGAMKISPSDVYWCMVKMPRLLELEAWVQIEASALPVSSDLPADFTCKVTHLKLQFWIQAFFQASQSILFELISIPAHLRSLILYDISFYRYVPLPPLVEAVSSSTKTLQHFELRQHIDGRVQVIDQFGSASFANFTALSTLVLPCMYHLSPSDVQLKVRFPDQLESIRLCTPSVLSWDELCELFRHKPTGLQTIIADMGLDHRALEYWLSLEFPRVVANVLPTCRRSLLVGGSFRLDVSKA
jgi:hypothetical protein